MTRVFTAVFGILLCSMINLSGSQAPSADTKAAETAVTGWLALVDNKDYAASWKQSASFFQSKVSQDMWQKAVATAREPLGAVKSRKLSTATTATTLPGAPAGEYVVFQFETIFEKRSAHELATTVKETDGSWRVVGYFVK